MAKEKQLSTMTSHFYEHQHDQKYLSGFICLAWMFVNKIVLSFFIKNIFYLEIIVNRLRAKTAFIYTVTNMMIGKYTIGQFLNFQNNQ